MLESHSREESPVSHGWHPFKVLVYLVHDVSLEFPVDLHKQEWFIIVIVMVSRSKQCWCHETSWLTATASALGQVAGVGAGEPRASEPSFWVTGGRSAAPPTGEQGEEVGEWMPRLASLQSCPLPAVSSAPAVVTFLKLGSDPVLLWLRLCQWPPPADHPGSSILPAVQAYPPGQPPIVAERLEPREARRAGLAAEERSRARAHWVYEPRLRGQPGEGLES